MKFRSLKLKKLIVNPENDRHGPKPTESEAIDWLFEEHGDKMMSLASDIVEQGGIFDAPLVKLEGANYVVFDGNRRVTCLKLLSGAIIPPERYKRNFNALRAQCDSLDFSTVSCQVEDDQNIINQIVNRRHNGTDGGRGQLRWDTRAKAIHANRVGGTNQYPIAEAVEDFLHENGYPYARDIGRSTVYRLLNAKKRQKEFGVSLNEDGSLKLLREKSEVLAALSQVADDILDKELTLKNVLNLDGIENYLSKLRDGNLIQTVSDPNEPQKPTSLSGGTRKVKTKPATRDTLIPKVSYDIVWGPGLGKAEQIWSELQFTLKFTRNQVSIPILFRSLIELSTHHADQVLELKIKQGVGLAKRVRSVGKRLKELGLLDNNELRDLERLLGDTSSPRELEVLNRSIHSQTALPAKEDLIAMWASFEKYIVLCIRIEPEGGRSS